MGATSQPSSRGPRPPSDAGQPTASEPVVLISVFGRQIPIAEHVLCAAASRLQIATQGYVPLEDYAASVGIVLEALTKRGFLST